MYGCRRGSAGKLNHTNLICSQGNQITHFFPFFLFFLSGTFWSNTLSQKEGMRENRFWKNFNKEKKWLNSQNNLEVLSKDEKFILFIFEKIIHSGRRYSVLCCGTAWKAFFDMSHVYSQSCRTGVTLNITEYHLFNSQLYSYAVNTLWLLWSDCKENSFASLTLNDRERKHLRWRTTI